MIPRPPGLRRSPNEQKRRKPKTPGHGEPAAGSAWGEAFAPALEDFQALADEAFASLPDSFRSLCEGVIIRVVDFPDREALEAVGADDAFDLLGLFSGRGLAQLGAGPFTGDLPNMIFLYRRPILDYWAAHEETLGALVSHVLIHEIGHHFGLSDDDMDRIERAAGPD